MIIGFAGRCRSGKTELARVCEKFGYERTSFATPLKKLCCDILDVPLGELNAMKNNRTKINLVINDNICKKLSEKTDIPIQIVTNACLGVTIVNIRHMLQFIGTDLIRRYNVNWHVERIREELDKDKNYVFDDVRFPNEKKLIEELGGDCWFITRTTLDNISNHESETSITWHNCWSKIIVNDSTLDYLLFRWETFMENYEKSNKLRDTRLNIALDKCIRDDVNDMSPLDMLMISDCMFTYIPKDFENNEVKSAKMNDDNSVVVTYKDGTLEFITNQLQIEDLKKYL